MKTKEIEQPPSTGDIIAPTKDFMEAQVPATDWFDERKEANEIAAQTTYDGIYDAAITAFKKIRGGGERREGNFTETSNHRRDEGQVSPPSQSEPATDDQLAERLHKAWGKYTQSFGEPPHGTLKQIKAMLCFIPKSDTATDDRVKEQVPTELWIKFWQDGKRGIEAWDFKPWDESKHCGTVHHFVISQEHVSRADGGKWIVEDSKPNVLISPSGKRFVIWADTQDDATDAEHLREAINAAIAAEQEKREKELHQLTIYLEGNCYADPDFIPDSRALKAAVTLRQQLLQAKAAISELPKRYAEHLEAAARAGELGDVDEKYQVDLLRAVISDIDLSALDKHDEEVREAATKAENKRMMEFWKGQREIRTQ